MKTSAKFWISPILKIWVVLGRFAIFLVVPADVDWFRFVLEGSGLFWLVSDFSKYEHFFLIVLLNEMVLQEYVFA